jgi:hypothetical protein
MNGPSDMKHFVRSTPFLLASVVLLASCAPQLHVPATLVGNVEVKLVNDTDETLCEITLTRNGENIVKGGGFFAHKTGSIALKPGSYDIHASSVACGGYSNGDRHVEVQQATEIHIGGNAQVAAAGFALASISMTAGAAPEGEAPQEPSSTAAAPSGPTCKPVGAEASGSQDCCSNKVGHRPDVVGWVCCDGGKGCG